MGTMQDWFPQSDAQEDADLEGEPVTRVTGKLDLSAALTDLKELAKKPGMSSAEGLKELSNGDIKERRADGQRPALHDRRRALRRQAAPDRRRA